MRLSDVESKRDKFMNNIRAKQRQNFIELSRQSQTTELPAVSYLPILISSEAYEEIDQIIEFIEINPGYELSDKCLQSIQQRSEHHADQKVRLLMFKLLNRLQKWRQSDVVRALQYYSRQDCSIMKELSIYLESKGQRVSCGIDLNEKEISSYEKQVIFIFTEMLANPPALLNSQYRLCWLDIVLRAAEMHPDTLEQYSEQIESVLVSVDDSQMQQHEIVRLISLFSKMVKTGKNFDKIVQLQCFPILLKQIIEGSIENVLAGLEFLAELLAKDEVIIRKLVYNFHILKLLKKYINHIFVPVQIRALWAISNIACSEQHKEVLNDSQVIEDLFRKMKEARVEIKIEVYFCILNLISSCSASELEELCQDRPGIYQNLISMIQQSGEPKFRDFFLHRSLYAVYHLIKSYPHSYLVLESFELCKKLNMLYENEKEEQNQKMINEVLNLCDLRDKQHSAQKSYSKQQYQSKN